MEPFDFVIVGAGSSGCVLARRLSEDPGCRVLLVEAGHDYLPGQEPAAILDSFPLVAYFTRDFIWRDLRVTFRPVGNGPDRPPLRNYEQARLVGGGSSINGQFANRGAPDDFDQWERLGAEGWSWDQVLPYFRRLEHDLDFTGPLHGSGGPIPIRRIFPHLWSGFTRAAVSAFEANGFNNIGDQNGAWADGYFPTTFSNAYDRRVSAAIGYLDSATRARPNLEIATRAMVMALRFEGIRAVGLSLRTANGERREIDARTTILCAGALHTPGLLMRAGIGPADRLRALGIELRAARPGVGAHLNDHPSVGVAAYLTPKARLDRAVRRHIHVALRYTARTPDAVPGDMFLCPLNRTAWHSVGYRLCSLMTILNKPFSRGRMTITSADPDGEPEVDFNLLSDERDMARMIDAVRFNHALYQDPALRNVSRRPFLASYTERVRRLSAFTPVNRALTAATIPFMDGPDWVRDPFIRRFIAEGAPIEDLLGDETALRENILRVVAGVWHAAGTCRMGAPADPGAVVDPRGRVIGVSGLRVADCSIIPVLPRANTNLAAIMIGEKMADLIRADASVGAKAVAA